MKKQLLWSLVAVLLITGCSNTAVKSKEENQKDLSYTVATESNTPIPSWLYEAFKTRFNDPSLVKPEDINILKLRMKLNEDPQIAAYLTVDRLNGLFILFELQGDKYKEVYVKNEPIYGVQVLENSNKRYLSLISGLGGNGYQDNFFYLLGYTPKGYQEVWKGTAEQYLFGPENNYKKVAKDELQKLADINRNLSVYWEKYVGLAIKSGLSFKSLSFDSTSRPSIAPDKKQMAYITPLEWEELGDVFIYNFQDETNIPVIKAEYLEREHTPKKAEWLDNRLLLVIIGYAYGTVSVGGNLYLYDTVEQQLLQVTNNPSNQEIKDFKIGPNSVTMYFVHFDKGHQIKQSQKTVSSEWIMRTAK